MSFRVPMYYFLSGLFFKTYSGFGEFARKKVNNIIVPLVFFYLVAAVWAFCIKVWPIQVKGTVPFEWKGLLDIFTDPRFNGTTGWHFNAPLWFLLSLFWVNVIYYGINAVTGRQWLKWVVVMALSVVGYECDVHKIQLPYMLDTSLVAIPYFALGAEVRKVGWLKPSKYDRWGVAVLVVVLSLIALWAHYAQQSIDIYMLVVPDYWALYVIPAVAILSLMWACKPLPRVPLICYWGRYSLVILGTHYFMRRPVSLAVIGAWKACFSTPLLKWQCWWISLIVIMLLELVIIWVSIRLFPYFTAQKEIRFPKKKKD